MLEIIRSHTVTVPKEELRPYLPRAREITSDPKDTPYVALALAFNVPPAMGDKATRFKY